MKELTLIDFEPILIADTSCSYFSKVLLWKGKTIEICIEPCLNGFDIAFYDEDKELIGPKKDCTNIKKTDKIFEGFTKALEIVNKKLKKLL